MLVITRKVDQSIVIDGKVEITITGIGTDGVRLGINAPRDVQIHRREVFDAIAEANREAARAQEPTVQDLAALLRTGLPQVRKPGGR